MLFVPLLTELTGYVIIAHLNFTMKLHENKIHDRKKNKKKKQGESTNIYAINNNLLVSDVPLYKLK